MNMHTWLDKLTRGWYQTIEWFRKPTLALTLCAHVIVLFILFSTPAYPGHVSTIPGDFNRATQLRQGLMKQTNYTFEYPPLAFPFFVLPRLFADDVEQYRLAFGIQMAAIDLLIAILSFYYARRKNLNFRPILAAQLLFLIAADNMILLERFDLAPSALVLLALFLWPRNGGVWSWLSIGLGTMIKVFPGAIAPLFIIDHIRKRQWRHLVLGLCTFGAAIALPALIQEFYAPKSILRFFYYQKERGVQIESVFASPYLIKHYLGIGRPLFTGFAYGAEEIFFGWSWRVSRMAVYFIVGAVLLTAWLYSRKPADDDRRIRFAIASILAFTVSNKVLSAQYVIWSYSLVPLLLTRRNVIWPMYFAILWLTHVIYPHGWSRLTQLEFSGIFHQVIRNILLVAMWIVLLTETKCENRLPPGRDTAHR